MIKTAKSGSPSVVMVGPWPPPEGGWATAIREEREELERRGIVCEVLDIGPNRLVYRSGCVPVRGPLDLFGKIVAYSLKGSLLRLHTNGDSAKGIAIVVVGELASLLRGRRACISFHAGVNQRYFPHRGNIWLRLLWSLVFGLAGIVVCDCEEVRAIIARYRNPSDVFAISPFSPRRISFVKTPLGDRLADFARRKKPLLFTYFAYRPEYQMDVFVEALDIIRRDVPTLGCIAVCDPSFPLESVEDKFKRDLVEKGLAETIEITGHLGRDEFLTLLSSSDLFVRTAVTDGVCSSVLESLCLGVPVVAADNGCRPSSVITYLPGDCRDLALKVLEALGKIEDLKATLRMRSNEIKDGARELADLVETRCLSARRG